MSRYLIFVSIMIILWLSLKSWAEACYPLDSDQVDFTFPDWEAAFNHLADAVAQFPTPQVVVIDEFTYLVRCPIEKTSSLLHGKEAKKSLTSYPDLYRGDNHHFAIISNRAIERVDSLRFSKKRHGGNSS